MRHTHGLAFRPPALVLCAVLAAAGCARAPAASSPATTPTPAPAPVTTRFVRVPDANTVAIILMANNVDLAYARIATARATHRDVRAYARRMTEDHTALNASLSYIITRLRLTPRDDDISRQLREESVGRRDTLRALSGRRFDSAYVANEVRYHQELLVAIDRVFTPSVSREDIKTYVAELRPTITEHLQHAERVQATLAARK
jgi:putative membrane protein